MHEQVGATLSWLIVFGYCCTMQIQGWMSDGRSERQAGRAMGLTIARLDKRRCWTSDRLDERVIVWTCERWAGRATLLYEWWAWTRERLSVRASGMWFTIMLFCIMGLFAVLPARMIDLSWFLNYFLLHLYLFLSLEWLFRLVVVSSGVASFVVIYNSFIML
jgi:hypothetical protein